MGVIVICWQCESPFEVLCAGEDLENMLCPHCTLLAEEQEKREKTTP